MKIWKKEQNTNSQEDNEKTKIRQRKDNCQKDNTFKREQLTL